MEVIRDEVVIAVLNNCIDKSRECPFVAESALLDGFKDFGQCWVDLVLAIEVVVTEILNIFSKVSKKENVLVACLPSDFDLRMCQYISFREADENSHLHHRKFQ